MQKQLTQIESNLNSTLIIKIKAWPYEQGKTLDYLSIDYDKPSDSVSVSLQTEVDLEKKRISLKEAEFVTWLIPQIRALEMEFNTSIESIKITYDTKGLTFDIQEVRNVTE
ncbi:hypothetical protein [Acinetobacter gerneri]|jgi:hypothetical protein|uniref:hypothetical protein n=1 Tax=Acinetobacter gerneri TaxID=202952 RepID=UPI0023F2320C|nr:hypothetical protein [Acinetobacter gerneri]MCH4245929.1 hypothetical protein [Acinetobacter gerneri]